LAKRLTIEFVKSEFEKEGYFLLSDEYINTHLPLHFLCPNGHIHKISFSAWRKGQRCIKCLHNKLRCDIGYIRESFLSEGYTLLTTTKRIVNRQI